MSLIGKTVQIDDPTAKVSGRGVIHVVEQDGNYDFIALVQLEGGKLAWVYADCCTVVQ